MTWFYDKFSSTLAAPQESFQKLLLARYTLTNRRQIYDERNVETVPRDQDLVVFFHQNAADDRVAWGLITQIHQSIIDRNNKLVLIVIVRTNNQSEPKRGFRLGQDIERVADGHALCSSFEMERQGAANNPTWRDDNSIRFARIIEFLDNHQTKKPVVVVVEPEKQILQKRYDCVGSV